MQIREGSIVRFRCHTGHAFSIETLIAEVNAAIATGLWDTLGAVEEKIMLLRQMGELAETQGSIKDAEFCRSQAKSAEERLKPLPELVPDPGLYQLILNVTVPRRAPDVAQAFFDRGLK